MYNPDSEPPCGPERYALPPGTRVQEFEVLTVIGGGGFGIVYLAQDHSLQRRVALKEYMPPLAARNGGSTEVFVPSQRDSDTFGAGLRSFVNEARLLARFDHPALVKVHRFWEENGTAYMVMPFYEGPTLQRGVADKRVQADEGSLRRLLDPLMDALAALHREPCYHRDISPDNILLTPMGPVLLDFGAARLAIGETTHNFTVILKEGYAPVEQYATEEATAMRQGPWTDIYALAGVVRFVITGKKPISAVIRMAEVADPLEPLANLLPLGVYSEPFVCAIDRAMSIHVEQRPQSIEEFRALLSALPSTLESQTLVRRVYMPPAKAPSTAPFVPAPAQPAPAPQPRQAAAPQPSVARPAPPPRPPAASVTALLEPDEPSPKPHYEPAARAYPPHRDRYSEAHSRGSLAPWVATLLAPLGLALAAAAYHYYPAALLWLNSRPVQPVPLVEPNELTTPHQESASASSSRDASPPPVSTASLSSSAPTSSASASGDPIQPGNAAPPDTSEPTSSEPESSGSSSGEPVAPVPVTQQPATEAPGSHNTSVSVQDTGQDKSRAPGWNAALLLMIKAARTGSWRAVEDQSAAIARVAKSPPEVKHVDHVESRAQNDLGRAALRAHNFAKAIAAFEKATHDDPSDIEIANNYGYALSLAGKKTEAQDVLTHDVLLRDPTREVAWTALVEARSEDTPEALAALKIALHFAASRERTLNNFREMAQTHRDARVRSVVNKLLEQSDSVPTVLEGQR